VNEIQNEVIQNKINNIENNVKRHVAYIEEEQTTQWPKEKV
jgi:hypothetical protein